MTDWLLQKFMKNRQGTDAHKERAAYGTLGSAVGIVVNLLLALVKFLLGVASGSLAVTADAVNNLSDAAGSIMSLISVRVAEKPHDKEHPFGHGRMEYIGALAIGALIVLAGIQLLREGIDGIVNPALLSISPLAMALLAAAALVKLWLFFFYRRIAKRIDSETLKAASKDSLSDVAATGAVLISIVLNQLFGWQIDGYIGILVAAFVMKAGISVCKDTVDRLLGEKPNPELTHEIKTRMLAYEGIMGIHDLVVHDYGPGRSFASVHAEVSANDDIVAIHEVIDRAERDLLRDLGITVTIHMDPTVTDDPKVNAIHSAMANYLLQVDERLTLHDFRIVPGEKQINLVFDCVLPPDFADVETLRKKIATYAKQLDERYEVVVQFDTDYED